MRFRPINGLCVLLRAEGRKKIGLIELPDSAVKESETCVVLECCETWVDDTGRDRKSDIKPGDHVVINKYSGQEFDIAGKDFNGRIVLVRQKDILSILDEVDFHKLDLSWGQAIPVSQPIVSAAPPRMEFNGPAGVSGDGIGENMLTISA
jgi:co-chaperonin GroES (HSP10)